MALAEDPGITLDELRLAARNHAMPLEALRWPITPVGLHYLLIHYDVPLVDPDALAARGRRRRRDALVARRSTTCARRDAVELTATMECAGNGRALLEPRPISQPWLTEAVGTARWRGVPLADAARGGGAEGRRRRRRLRRARPGRRGRRRAAVRAEPAARGGAGVGRRARLRDERRAAAAAARLPAPPRRARLVRHDERQVAVRRSPSSTEPFAGYQVASGYRVPPVARTRRDGR